MSRAHLALMQPARSGCRRSRLGLHPERAETRHHHRQRLQLRPGSSLVRILEVVTTPRSSTDNQRKCLFPPVAKNHGRNLSRGADGGKNRLPCLSPVLLESPFDQSPINVHLPNRLPFARIEPAKLRAVLIDFSFNFAQFLANKAADAPVNVFLVQKQRPATEHQRVSIVFVHWNEFAESPGR